MLSVQRMAHPCVAQPIWEKNRIHQLGCFFLSCSLVRRKEANLHASPRGRGIKTNKGKNRKLFGENRIWWTWAQPLCDYSLCTRGFPEALLVGPQSQVKSSSDMGPPPLASLPFLTPVSIAAIYQKWAGTRYLGMSWSPCACPSVNRPQRGMLRFHIHERFQVALYGAGGALCSWGFCFIITGRGGGWLTALLRGEWTREGWFHVPGDHPTLPPIQVTPGKTPWIFK